MLGIMECTCEREGSNPQRLNKLLIKENQINYSEVNVEMSSKKRVIELGVMRERERAK